MSGTPFIYRFSRDLRLTDHAGLAAIAQRGPIVPVLCIDAELTRRLRVSPRRAAFFCGAVRALDAELRGHGSALTVCPGASGREVVRLARSVGAAGVAWSAGAAAGDAQLQSSVEEAGLEAIVVHDAPAVALDETASKHTGGEDAYRSFGPYFEAWSRSPIVSYEQPLLMRFAPATAESQALPHPQDFGSEESIPDVGAAQAWHRFESFCNDGIADYEEALRTPWMSTSRLSADLSFGTVASRTLVRTLRSRFDEQSLRLPDRAGIRAFLRSLARRDFFLQLAHFFPESRSVALRDRMRSFPFARAGPAFDRWRNGETGFPLVDAGMRQLRETGWMHPFVRAVSASFCCFDLGVHWNAGMAEWDRHLIEDDPLLSSGNWQWIAASGADMAQYPRIYNPERARRRSDPEGRYVRRWISQLAHMSAESLVRRAAGSPQLALDLSESGTYPDPIVDHDAAARDFLRRYRAFVSAPSR